MTIRSVLQAVKHPFQSPLLIQIIVKQAVIPQGLSVNRMSFKKDDVIVYLTFSKSSSFNRMLAFLLASAACWSLAFTMVSTHWWHFFNSSFSFKKMFCSNLRQSTQNIFTVACTTISSMLGIHNIFGLRVLLFFCWYAGLTLKQKQQKPKPSTH